MPLSSREASVKQLIRGFSLLAFFGISTKPCAYRCRRHSAVPWNPGPWIHPWGEFTEREIQWVHWLNLLQCRKRSLAVFWHWVLDQNRCGDLWKEMIWAALNAGKGLLLFLWHWSLEQKDAAAYSAVVRVYWTGNGNFVWGRDLQPLRKDRKSWLLFFAWCIQMT